MQPGAMRNTTVYMYVRHYGKCFLKYQGSIEYLQFSFFLLQHFPEYLSGVFLYFWVLKKHINNRNCK